MREAALVLLTGALVGCLSLTPAGQAVRVTTNPDVVRGCTFVGEVAGASTSWSKIGNQYGQPGALDQENAEVTLRNRAGAMGANVVFLNTRTAYKAAGEAYVCGVQPSRGPDPAGRFSTSAFTDPYLRGFWGLVDQLAALGGIYAPLATEAGRSLFNDYLYATNPLVEQIDLAFLARAWQACLANESQKAKN